jgi:hypothetical protein
MSCSVGMEEGHHKSKKTIIHGKVQMWKRSVRGGEVETAKPLQLLELVKAIFNCGRNRRRWLASVRHHERNSLDMRKKSFLKLIMQSSHFFERCKTGINSIVFFVQHIQYLYHFSKTQLLTVDLFHVWFIHAVPVVWIIFCFMMFNRNALSLWILFIFPLTPYDRLITVKYLSCPNPPDH